MCDKPREVAEGVWRVSAPMIRDASGRAQLTVNAYLVVDGGEAAFVDTGWWYGLPPSHLDALLDAAGIAPGRVTTVALTHAHRDHAGHVNYLEERTGATPWVHRAEDSALKGLEGHWGLIDVADIGAWYGSHGFPADFDFAVAASRLPETTIDLTRAIWGEGYDEIRVGSRKLVAVPTPGHTDGHVSLFEAESGIVFSGDALLPRGHGNPHVTCRPLTSTADPLTAYVDGLHSVRDLRPRLCLPGHGPQVTEVEELVDAHLTYADRKIEAVEACLDPHRGLTAFEVARRLPWRGGRKRFDQLEHDELWLAFGDTLARLRRLVTLGRVKTSDGPVVRYSPA